MPEDDRETAREAKGAEEQVQNALEAAETARRQRRYQDGVNLLLDALELNVQTDQVYYRLGNIYYDAGDLGRAEYVYRRALEVNPHHVNAHYNLAVIFKKTGRLHESVRMQKRAVKLEATGKVGRYLMRNEPPAFSGSQSVALQSLDAQGIEGLRLDGYRPGGPAARDEDGPDPADRSSVTQQLPEPESLPSRDDLANDPEFRRWGRNLALKGLLFMLGFAAIYLVAIYFLGSYLF